MSSSHELTDDRDWGKHSGVGWKAFRPFRPEGRVWGKPYIVSSVNPDAFGTPDSFNSIKACEYLPRPGISGAAWETTMRGPQREREDPSFFEGVSQFGTQEWIDAPSIRGRTPPGFPAGGYGGAGPNIGLPGVHYRISCAAGISGKLQRKYSPSRPPTPIRRLLEMEARRHAQANSRQNPEILLVDQGLSEDFDGAGTRPATRGIDGVLPATRGSRLSHSGPDSPDMRVRINDRDHGRRQGGDSPYADRHVPIEQRLKHFSNALTKRFSTALSAYRMIDADGSGSVSLEELARGLSELGIEIDTSSLKKLMTAAGISSRGNVPYKDFQKLFLGKYRPLAAEDKDKQGLADVQDLIIRKFSKSGDGDIDFDSLITAFRAFDDNGDGWIDRHELVQGFLSLGLGDLNDAQGELAPLKRLVDSTDDNDDGKINYKEFLEMIGIGQGRDKFSAGDVKGGGAAQGFKDMSKYDAKILARERRIKELKGEGYVEPETPRGLTRWRAKFAKSFFGDKYMTDMDKAAKALVADKAEGRYVEPKAPVRLATKRYMEQVFRVKPQADDMERYPGIQTTEESENESKWDSTLHHASRDPYVSLKDRGRNMKSPNLPRVSKDGASFGLTIPGYHPGVHRRTGAVRKGLALTEEWNDQVKANAIYAAVKLTHDPNERPKYLRDPSFEAGLRLKTVRDVTKDYNDENQIDFSNTRSLTGPVDVHNPFSRFGGHWTLHDTVQGILHSNYGESVRPLDPTGAAKPIVEAADWTQKEKQALRKRLGEPFPVFGRSTTELDANRFMSQPLQRDLFCRTILHSGKRNPGNSKSPPKSRPKSVEDN